MEFIVVFTVLFAFVTVPLRGDVTNTNPRNGACLCLSSNLNLRSSATVPEFECPRTVSSKQPVWRHGSFWTQSDVSWFKAQSFCLDEQKAACGSVVVTASSGECYKYLGTKQRCSLSGSYIGFFKIDYKGMGRWAAGSYLDLSSDSRCGGGSSGRSSGRSSGTPAGKLSDSEARSRLRAAGISVNYPEPKTSLNNVREASISGIIRFKNDSRCSDVVVTGGTESGHGSSTATAKSHANGYKLDIRMNSCVDNYIINNYRHTASDKWRDGTELYFDSRGNQFARETKPPHWDIVFQ